MPSDDFFENPCGELLPDSLLCYEGRVMAPAAPFPYHLAASDLDGTLLSPQKEISPANLAAVHALQARGARFILASGRRHQNSIRFYREVGLNGLLISCAGALIKDPDTGETLREVTLAPATAAKLVSEGRAGGFTVVYYHRDHLYVAERNHWTDLYESRVGEKVELYPGSLDDLRGEAALKIVWYGEPARLKERRARTEEAYKDRATVVATDPENLEFVAPTADKAAALAAVCAFYQVEQAATLAFGDGENDAPMLRWAGLGVAVDGAAEAAKSAARLEGQDGAKETRFARAVEAVFHQLDGTR